jgi:hypothetical protein
MLSFNVVIVIGSTRLGFETCTVNVNVPPGTTMLVGLATFVTPITGAGKVTDSFASPHAVAAAALFASPLYDATKL